MRFLTGLVFVSILHFAYSLKCFVGNQSQLKVQHGAQYCVTEVLFPTSQNMRNFYGVFEIDEDVNMDNGKGCKFYYSHGKLALKCYCVEDGCNRPEPVYE